MSKRTRQQLVSVLGLGLMASLAVSRAAEPVSEADRAKAIAELNKRGYPVTDASQFLNAAAQIVFLVSGAEKAATLHRVLEGPVDADALPAQAIAPRDGVLTWLVDAAAAAELRGLR